MICPSCKNQQNITEHNFGALYTCTSCRAVYFVDFEGKPDYGEVSSETYEIANQENRLNQSSSTNALTASSSNFGGLAEQSPPTELMDQSLSSESSSSGDRDFENAVEFENNLEPLMDLPSLGGELDSPDPMAPQTINNGLNSFAGIAQEISDFANTDSNLAGLNYDLFITGIDTAETRSLFKEAIEDSKFAWDSFEIMKSLKNGRIELLKLSPAKAFLLAKRIQFLDIEKTWKQNALS